MINKLFPYITVIVFISFLGFITENLWICIRFGFYDNRGMLLPGLIGYGFAITIIYLILGTPAEPRFFYITVSQYDRRNALLYYVLMAAVMVSIGEIILGNIVERICHMEWWNYSSLPFHIGKYTSVFTSVGFGLLITVFMDRYFTRMIKWAVFLENPVVRASVYLAFLLYCLDYVNAMRYMIINKKLHNIWKRDIRHRHAARIGY